MADQEGFLRNCLVSSLPEHEAAAELLSEAANAILARDLDLARDRVQRANMPVLYDHAALIMSGRHPRLQPRRPVVKPAVQAARMRLRLPSDGVTKFLFSRDGWRCRFCDCRVIPPKARAAMRNALPGVIPWSETEGFHGAFYAMSASVDHIVPHSAGGTNDEENLVTACWSCQFGRGAWSLEEVGLRDPRARPPLKDNWDGLDRPLKRITPTAPKIRDDPPPARKLTGLPAAEWFSSLDAVQPASSSRMLAFVDTCSDLGVRWSLNDVLLVQMTVGKTWLNVLGIQQNGRFEIPWSINDKKHEFRTFAQTLARGISEAVIYETPKTWIVSKARKQRLNVLELLEEVGVLRDGLERLRAELDRS